jgi:hypothetical protein
MPGNLACRGRARGRGGVVWVAGTSGATKRAGKQVIKHPLGHIVS